jgi:hypothetical protein
MFGRRRAAPLAGDRPGRKKVRRSHKGPIALLVVLAVVAAGAWYAKDQIGGGVQAGVDRVRGVEQISASRTVKDSGHVKGHGPELLIDGPPNTYWAPKKTGAATGSWVQFRFEQPTDLRYLRITGGVSGQDEAAWRKQGRPQDLVLTLFHADGTKETRNVRLEDQLGDQKVAVSADGVQQLRMTLGKSAFGAEGGHRVAVGEVAFFSQRP